VSKFVTNIASAGRLLSDSNGREMLHRRRDWRPQWNLTQTEPVAGNYFPINSAVAIADAQNQLTVLVDSAQGAGSIQDGELEVMVHRRLVMDDNRGVGEPLNETQFTTSYNYYNGGASYGPALIVRGRHWVSIESPAQAASIWRPLQDRLYATPVLAFTEAPAVPFTTSSASMLIAPLPPNVQLMTLHSLNATSMLLRLSHSFGINEDAALSKPVQVDLSRLFDVSAAGFKVIGIEEVSLSNNQPKSAILERRRRAMHWNTGSRSEAHSWRMVSPLNFDSDPVVVLGPLEIKTFALTVSYAR
jgi:hypothetical protein